MSLRADLRGLLAPGSAQETGGIVPPSGYSARLTVMAAAAMAFLAVFALALSLAAGRVAAAWSDVLAGTATIRISAPAGQVDPQAQTVLRVLEQTPGVAEARLMDTDAQRTLLEPWLGTGLPIEDLPIPAFIEITSASPGFDAEGLRQRLAAEAPGAVLDDHARWRRPMVEAAGRLRLLGWVSLVLIGAATAGMVVLATAAALAANAQVIRTLRLVGAEDGYIARAFIRRFTLRAVLGAAAGALAGVLAVLSLPGPGAATGVVMGLRFQGLEWTLPLLVPVIAGLAAFAATRATAYRTLQGVR